MGSAFSMNLLLGDSPNIQEVPVYLLIKFFSVSNYQEGVIALKFSEYLLGKENHGKALTAPLGMPKNSKPPLILFDTSEGFNDIVDAKILMVFSDYFIYCSS